MRILLVEDDEKLAAWLRKGLEEERHYARADRPLRVDDAAEIFAIGWVDGPPVGVSSARLDLRHANRSWAYHPLRPPRRSPLRQSDQDVRLSHW